MSRSSTWLFAWVSLGACTGLAACHEGDEFDDGSGTDDAAESCPRNAFTEVEGCPLVGESFCSDGTAHVSEGATVDWAHNPPHSGRHYPSWAVWGEHADIVPRGNWVHNLEHGGIVLLYRCPEGCPDARAILRSVVDARPSLRILMTADPDLDGPPFAAVAWRWVLETEQPDLAELLCFADQHEGHAPEDIP